MRPGTHGLTLLRLTEHQLFDALAYLNIKGIAHTRLNAHSVRVTPDLRVVLCMRANLLFHSLANFFSKL
jgi:hypothetical protein